MISETLVEVMNAEGPQLHTHAVPKAVVKKRRRQSDSGTGRWPQ